MHDPSATGSGGSRLWCACAWLAALPFGFWLMNAGYDALESAVAGRGAFDWRVVGMAWNHLAAGLALLLVNALAPGPSVRLSAVAVVSALYLGLLRPEALVWLLAASGVLWLALGREGVPGRAASMRFWLLLSILLLIAPKLGNGLPGFDWLPQSDILLQGVFLRHCYLYYERRKGLIPAVGLHEHLAYLLFIPQVFGILNFPHSEMRGAGHSWRLLGLAGQSFLLAALKIGSLAALHRLVLGDFGFALGARHIESLDRAGLWWALLANYIAWFLQLSASLDLMTAVVRMLGVPVENSFRWALLAASPIELWRRWNIYNRKLLLKFIYFPLGGSRRRLYRNVLATFLGSALLLHSGWFGGPWLYPDPARLLDECLYFLLQGLLVCAALAARRHVEKLFPKAAASRPGPADDPFSRQPDRHPVRRLLDAAPAVLAIRIAGIAFTLAASAWCHAVILMSGHKLAFDPEMAPTLARRLVLMARALGLPM